MIVKGILWLAFFVLSGTQGTDDKCVTYSVCGVDQATSLHIPCPYDGPPKPFLNSSYIPFLRENCPALVGENDTEPLLCCDYNQVDMLITNYGQLSQLLGRCPSCFINLAQVFCMLSCAPNQSQFLQVTNTTVSSNKTAVKEMSYYITNYFTKEMYKSCENVQMSLSPDHALMYLCGMSCDPYKLLNTLGTHNPSPIQINFQFEDNPKGYHSMNNTVVPCNKPVKEGGPPCSCVDCPCGPPPLPPPSEPWIVFGLPGMWTVMIFIFAFLFGVVTLGYIIWILNSKEELEEYQPLHSGDHSSINQSSILEDDSPHLNFLESLGHCIEYNLQKSFTSWGRICATHPFIIFFIGVGVVTILSCGLLFFTVTTDPVELWSAKNSQAREERDYFNQHFSPFYRTEQVIITRTNSSSVLDQDFILKILELQNNITGLTAENNNKIVKVEDICFAPMSNGKCAIQSVPNWFQNNASKIAAKNYWEHLDKCIENPMLLNSEETCLGEYGGPIYPYVALGGFPDNNYSLSDAIILTILVNNHVNATQNEDAMAWESKFIKFMKNFSDDEMNVAFSSERSIQDELERESQSDVTTVIISYLVMFLYVSFALGRYPSVKACPVTSKVTLGLSGVLIVLASVVSSLGFFSYVGVSATLIIVEVIPFLVLAVGVDNIFILVQAYQRSKREEGEILEDQFSRIVGEVAPSFLLAAVSECSCFFLGSLSHMPAVHVFSFYAGLALFIDFFLQMFCFLPLMYLDIKREQSGKFDIFCCGKDKPLDLAENEERSLIYKFFKQYYASFLMKDVVRVAVLIFFIGGVCSSIAVVNEVDVGLDQQLSMPEDSYVLTYFDALQKYLAVGPPVYFVVKSGFDYVNIEDENLICGVAYCARDSLLSQISSASLINNRTYIAHATGSWLDAYFMWANSLACCRINKTDNTFCPSNVTSRDCIYKNITDGHFLRPREEYFMPFLKYFLEDNPNSKCPMGGHPSYASAIEFTNSTLIGATYSMTYHTVLKTSHDYTNALKMSREMAKNITSTIKTSLHSDVEVFPYSIFYVFYEQYLTIVHDTVKNIAVSISAVFVITMIFMGLDLHTSLIIILTIMMILLDLMGLMFWWSISLNAVSLVNLVMAVGISVEFCSHITRAFILSTGETKKERAEEAVAEMGSSVLSGITLTKFGGILVLGFAKSQIFKVFYFRMYLGIVLFGAAHGLIFLPVLLSILGPPARPKGKHKTPSSETRR